MGKGRYRGKVTGFKPLRVECPDAPPHLQVMHPNLGWNYAAGYPAPPLEIGDEGWCNYIDYGNGCRWQFMPDGKEKKSCGSTT